jgi:DNA-binding CsgD family transcriptional regulator
VKSVTPLTLHMLPMRTSGSTFNDMFLTRARVIVLLRERKADEPADPSMVRDVLGLTLGEARIAALIGAGLSPRSAASKLGLTEESTRTALKRIFSKLGVSRQSELVALLSKLLLR